MSALYKFSNVNKVFSAPGENLEILKDINLVVEEGQALAIVGASGSGKAPSCILWVLLILQVRALSILTGRT